VPDRVLDCVLANDDEPGVAGVDEVAELLHVGPRHALGEVTAHAADNAARCCGAYDRGRKAP
jgi:hypothetical protein